MQICSVGSVTTMQVFLSTQIDIWVAMETSSNFLVSQVAASWYLTVVSKLEAQ